jgi:CPA2 family monovalent cation:H+ antiporter-2
VVLKLLFDNRDFESPYGKAAFSVLLLQDIAVIPMIVAVPFLVSRQPVASSFIDSLLPLILLALLIIVIFYIINKYAMPFILHRVSLTRNREIFFFTVIFICVGSAALMHKVGLSLSLGAFVAGMLLAGSPFSKQALAEVLPLRDSFLSLFFVSIGMMLDLPFLIHNFHKIFFLGTLIVTIKTLLLFALVWFTGSPGSVSRAVAALLFQFGEFSFILSELGVQNNLISEKDRQFFVAIAIFSLAVTPLIYKILPQLMHSQKLQDIIPTHLQNYFRQIRKNLLEKMTSPLDFDSISKSQDTLSDHVIVIGYGVAGQSLCRILQHLKIPVQVIELNAETVRVNTQHIPIIYGDAANPELLRKAGIKTARMAVVVTTGVNMLEPIMHVLERENPNLRIIARTNYLLDLKRLPASKSTQFVVSELETTLNIIDRTLRDFNIDLHVVDELVSELRKEFDLNSTLKVT